MPGRLDRINQILSAVEQKELAFRQTLARLNNCLVETGKVEILNGPEGRTYFRRYATGLPLWSDLTLVDRNAGSASFGVNLDFAVYHQEYTGLKARQLAATQDNLPLDHTDALEALTLAVLTGDSPAAEVLISRMARQFPAIIPVLTGLIGRGNARLHSAYGRVLALLNREEAWDVVREQFKREPAEGVRADIITATILDSRTNPDGLPLAILEEWLTGESLIDPLSCVLALTGLGLQLSADIFELIQPAHQPALKAWFEPEAGV